MTYFLHFMETPFKLGEYLTRDGRSFVVDCIRPDAAFPLLGYPKGSPDVTYSWHHDGTFQTGTSAYDLMLPDPEMVKVDLGPDDVPPGSVVRWDTDDHGWIPVAGVTRTGIHIVTTENGTLQHFPWDCLHHVRISRDNGQTWEPCEKLVPA